MWKHWAVTYSLIAGIIAVWIITIYGKRDNIYPPAWNIHSRIYLGISRIKTEWGNTVMLRFFTIACTSNLSFDARGLTICSAGLSMATILVILFLAGLFRARVQNRFNPLNRNGRYSQCSAWNMLYIEAAHFIIPIWVAQVIDSVRALLSLSE